MSNKNIRNPRDQGRFSRDNGIYTEETAYNALIEYFHEVYVHNQPRKGHISFDFIVYAQHATFAVDVFFYTKLKNMMSEAKEKIKKYSNFGQLIFIVQTNAQLDNNIQHLAPTAKQNIGLFDYDEFMQEVKKRFKPLEVPKECWEFDHSDLIRHAKANIIDKTNS